MRPSSSRWIATVLALCGSGLAASSATADVVPKPTPFVAVGFDSFLQADPECPDQTTPRQQRRERARATGPLAWLFRLDRDDDIERSSRPFAFYLRSPLLSGLYGCPPQSSAGPRTPEPVDECAELTITTTSEAEHTIQVLLPQYDLKNVRRLRAYVDDRLRKNHVVTLIMTGGEPFSIRPEETAGIAAKACRMGVWHY
jgi:hypothetical protein